MSRSTLASLERPAIRSAARRRPGPRGWRLLRDVLQMRHDRIGLVTRVTREYGDVVHFRAGPRRLALVAHPEAIRRVLVDNEQNYRKGLGLADARPLLGDGLLTSEGTRWACRRRAVQPAFQTAHLETFKVAVLDAARATAVQWSAAGERPIDLGRDMRRLALSAFAQGVLGVDVSTDRDALIDAFGTVEAWAMARSVALWPMPLSMPTPANRRVRAAQATLDRFVALVLQTARTASGPAALCGLVAALDADQRDPSAARDELMTLLLAGHETTGAALAWTWCCLGRHPAVETRVHQELDAVLGTRQPALADLAQLVYTRAVIDEVLRLYPPVWLIPRKAIAADQLGGEPIDAGTDVLLSVYSLHRHPGHWDDADRFDPDRFGPESVGRRASAVHMPFGLGSRACAASRFAVTEVLLVLAVLARRFSISGSWADASPEPSLTLRFPEGIRARALPRIGSPAP